MAEEKMTKEELLFTAIMAGDKEIELPPQVDGSKGSWKVKRELSAMFQEENGRSIKIEYDKRYKRFEMWIASGSGRNEIFYEDEIPLILEANEILKKLRKNLCQKTNQKTEKK